MSLYKLSSSYVNPKRITGRGEKKGRERKREKERQEKMTKMMDVR